MWKPASDMTRCDNIRRATITAPPTAATSVATIVSVIDLRELADRAPAKSSFRHAYVTQQQNVDIPRAINMVRLQDEWETFKASVFNKCSRKFWKFFLPMHKQPVNAIDAALRSAKSTFMNAKDDDWKEFPPNRRALLSKFGSGNAFWSQVRHDATTLCTD